MFPCALDKPTPAPARRRFVKSENGFCEALTEATVTGRGHPARAIEGGDWPSRYPVTFTRTAPALHTRRDRVLTRLARPDDVTCHLLAGAEQVTGPRCKLLWSFADLAPTAEHVTGTLLAGRYQATATACRAKFCQGAHRRRCHRAGPTDPPPNAPLRRRRVRAWLPPRLAPPTSSRSAMPPRSSVAVSTRSATGEPATACTTGATRRRARPPRS